MKHLLLTTIAAVLLVGCGPSVDIHKAAEEGNIEAVKQHIAAGTDLNAKHDPLFGMTPLYFAAMKGHKEVAELLIANDADVNAKNTNDWTPLHQVATKEIAELLIAEGADVNVNDRGGSTPLHFVAGKGHKETARLLITKGADVNAKNEDGETPLHMAALWGHNENAELLIAKGADVDAKGGVNGGTPLHWAAKEGHKETAELLIAKGADVNAKDDIGRTPLDWGKQFFDDYTPEAKAEIKQTADLIRKHGGKTGEELKAAEPVAEASKPEPPTAKAPDISIHDAAYEGNIEAVKQHLAAGTDVNAKGGYSSTANTLTIKLADRTPLHEAASWGHKEVAELLIDNGADVNVKSGFGQTPLHWACNEGRHVAELLIAKGADVNAKDDNGWTPLDHASFPDQQNDTVESANLLRKHGGKTGYDW